MSEYKPNKHLQEFFQTMAELVDAYIEEGKMSWSELIGALEIIKTEYSMRLLTPPIIDELFSDDEDDIDD